ncbi:probable 2-carboxy-D-arabinitol-1-phosphatase isoform X2 [Beta vulgaris subsp. vulgaris]|nr:probable 2-carboxy-D-arabinitol-1-phosphatase isoform X2 [Beta vulgaris subsp. vulgaris]XP_048497090.1 probable 2-carboxy-D-arabinitol-1-phosphatase isoform X2 [Beta vulgaris subsp. vulgaris]XP_048497091.1 probable 2-carboxy-D-arabinitol-1-phosphatase isoform X2 [Beta vulgaris subsp. vulgaris]
MSLTGGALDFRKATTSLSPHRLSSPKKITIVRHGLSSWNAESRVQVWEVQTYICVLTDAGAKQAERCGEALANIHFDKCFSSPISRAKSTDEILWQGKKEALIFLDASIFPAGMRNDFTSYD